MYIKDMLVQILSILTIKLVHSIFLYKTLKISIIYQPLFSMNYFLRYFVSILLYLFYEEKTAWNFIMHLGDYKDREVWIVLML